MGEGIAVTMLEFSIFEFCLVNFVSYMCGIGTGLVICCRNKETFMQRERSVENLQQFNHQSSQEAMNRVQQVQGYAPSAPHVSEICIKS